ncbi:DUF2254 domain-containing protein [Legionella spiritensis]|uniref:DUF2254 domain-containing protein n=1 Tax=Legionella spiritensis TaxID=452 RepID=A0A0W0Z5A7_LEGSP|nr:DUF2254 domain-containing protein [Legionella spiritensis]KTD64343.1 hypothetical protein Lspi_1150 [Legionella spiritensis]SNV46452.1 Predicted membrane protein (DUF2254) [Legionella spiritensis]
MKSAILNFFSGMRASYWFTPLFMAVVAILLSFITLSIDQVLHARFEETTWLHSYNPEGARAILSTIATVMITVASVTFSMTIVAISFTAGQIGPRLTSNFMRDRSNQFTLGVFIANFLFCLLILRSVSNASPDLSGSEYVAAFVPQLSLLVAIILAVFSIIVLIYFFHHIPESINMSNVIANVGESLSRQIDTVFPRGVGREIPEKSIHIPEACQRHHEQVCSVGHGYIRIIDGSSLIDTAQKYQLVIQLEVMPGDYVAEKSPMLTLYAAGEITDEIRSACRGAFALGHQRNQDQDIYFLISELVEIIARALSPGVNDPFTAMTCMDWLQHALQKISLTSHASRYRYDNEDHLRLITHPVVFDEFCEQVFCRILPYVCKDRNAALHMMDMIYQISRNIDNSEHKITLASHAESLKGSADECLLLREDRHALQRLYERYFQL